MLLCHKTSQILSCLRHVCHSVSPGLYSIDGGLSLVISEKLIIRSNSFMRLENSQDEVEHLYCISLCLGPSELPLK